MKIAKGTHQAENSIDNQEHFFNTRRKVYHGGVSNDNFIFILKVLEKRIIRVHSADESLFGRHLGACINKGLSHWFSRITRDYKSSIQSRVDTFLTDPMQYLSLKLEYHIEPRSGFIYPIFHNMHLCPVGSVCYAINFIAPQKTNGRGRFNASVSVRDRPFPSDIDGSVTISDREKEVLALIADGYSSKQIADKLFISDHTAISHRKNLISKFDAKNTAHLIKKAAEVIPLF